MKIVVPTKRVPDTDASIRVRDDGWGIETADLAFQINPFDAIALEEAVSIRERRHEQVEVLAVSVGRIDCEQELRVALAMGADRAVLIRHDDPLDPWNVARLLAAVVRREKPDLVLMGKQAVDDDSNQTGQFLAALLDWPQATFASKLEFVAGGLEVDRETDAGIERVRVLLPAVVTTDLRLNEPRYVSLANILRAKGKPIRNVASADLDVTIEPRVRLLGLEAPPRRRVGVRVPDVPELLRRLRDEARVL